MGTVTGGAGAELLFSPVGSLQLVVSVVLAIRLNVIEVVQILGWSGGERWDGNNALIQELTSVQTDSVPLTSTVRVDTTLEYRGSRAAF